MESPSLEPRTARLTPLRETLAPLLDLLRRWKRPRGSALILYAATLAFEVPALFARAAVLMLASVPASIANGESLLANTWWSNYAFLGLVWSASAFIVPIGAGGWWCAKVGGRQPSEREKQAFDDAMEIINASAPFPVRRPLFWFVLDSELPDAAVCGHALMLSRGMLTSEFLPAVLAHELGHLHTSDGLLTSALSRLVINPRLKEREAYGLLRERTSNDAALQITIIGALIWLATRLVRLAQGGLGLFLLAPTWGSYWRTREYAADDYAKLLGQGDDLADFLEIHALLHDRPVPFIWATSHTHPPTELRIDRLRRIEAPPAEDTEQVAEPVT